MASVLVLSAVDAERGDLGGISVGVGPVRAAIGACAALAEAPEVAVFVGTAGAYREGPAIGEVVVARRLGLSTGIAELAAGYAPLAPEPIEASRLRRTFGVPEADVLTVEAITTDPGLVAARGASWHVEHMEVFSVGLAAQVAGVPFVAVLGISNAVGPDAHAQWCANRDAAEAAARDVVRQWIAKR